MATLSLLLKTLEIVEEMGSFANFLGSTEAVLIITCFISHQLLLVMGYSPLASVLLASTITMTLNHSGCLRKNTF